MKAIRVHEFGGPEVMKLEEVPDLVAGPGQVVVDVKAIGVNPVESYIRTGTYAIKPNLPYTPGNDVAGVVKEVGAGVTSVKAGRPRVHLSDPQRSLRGTGALQRAQCPSACPTTSASSRVPASACPTEPPIARCFSAPAPRPAETVLVHGASGGVGIASVQFARAAGLTVFGTAGSDAGMELVKREGAHHVLNHSKEGYLDELMNLTQGQGVNIILEMLANKNLANDLNVIARHGRIIVIGNRGTHRDQSAWHHGARSRHSRRDAVRRIAGGVPSHACRNVRGTGERERCGRWLARSLRWPMPPRRMKR